MSDRRESVQVTCGHCKGSGHVEHIRMSEALRLLTSDWQPTRSFASGMGIGTTNAANVLRGLKELGFAERKGSGSHHSEFHWRRRSA